MVCYNVLWREYRRNEKVLKKKVLKQNNLLRLQKRLAVVMLALTLGLGTGCGKTDDGADGAASSEAETLADGQTNDQTDVGAEEENRQESKKATEDKDEPYVEGTYSSDSYDVAEFAAEPRKKTDEEGNRGVYYEIFVRSFADSDGDGIGDLNGVTEKLDYLQELGIDGIWLMPITASDTYHGYSVADYMTVNSDYGTEDDLKRLLDEAHSRDMKVIMDLVINHTSINHPWFQAAKSDENSEYRDYYRWVYKTDKKDCNHLLDKSSWGDMVWHQEGDFYYYGVFGADMPDLNYNNPDVRQAAKDAAGHWLELGLDGFRMDAAVHIYGAHEFKQQEDSEAANINWWNEFAGYCESINPDVYLVGEVWQDDKVLENYVQPFDTKFDFAIQQKILNCVQKGMAVPGFGDSLSVAIENIQNKYDGVDVNYLNGVFGANHDQDRIASSVNSLDKARQIAAVYMTLPGNPYIYYGEELGMYGSKPDEMIRTPFLWGDDSTYNTSWEKDDQNAETKGLDQQMKDPDSMYSYYKTLIALRKDNPALMKGNYRAAALTSDSVIAYFREADGQKLLVVHNFAEGNQTVSLAECGDITVTNVLYSSSGETGVSDLSSVKLAGNESVVLELGE